MLNVLSAIEIETIKNFLNSKIYHIDNVLMKHRVSNH